MLEKFWLIVVSHLRAYPPNITLVCSFFGLKCLCSLLQPSEIELPEGMTYEAGDYLSILPRNPVESITRVLSRFHLLPDQNVRHIAHFGDVFVHCDILRF